MKLLSHYPTLCDPMAHRLHQATLSMGFSRQEHWIRLPFLFVVVVLIFIYLFIFILGYHFLLQTFTSWREMFNKNTDNDETLNFHGVLYYKWYLVSLTRLPTPSNYYHRWGNRKLNQLNFLPNIILDSNNTIQTWVFWQSLVLFPTINILHSKELSLVLNNKTT